MTAATGPRTVAAVLVAAGSGERLQAGIPKAFVAIDGVTLLEHAVRRFATHPAVTGIVVVAPAADLDRAAELTRSAAALGDVAVEVVAGGATRQLSVAAGLAVTRAGFVLVHDVARPFVPGAVVDAVLAALDGGADAAVPVVPIHDTVRQIHPDGTLAGTVDRSTLVAIQTPQGFRRDVLVAAHAAGRGVPVTDDAGLVEAAGGTVVGVPGSEDAFKVTTQADLARATALARLGSPAT
jgi:2-C-methyl-D-erythritol 4-phosphate cytidylyltransferase